MSDAIPSSEFEENRRYTYADYLGWEGPERYQLINGEAFMMVSPSVAHQGIIRKGAPFSRYVQGEDILIICVWIPEGGLNGVPV
jgi:hypothetical protein